MDRASLVVESKSVRRKARVSLEGCSVDAERSVKFDGEKPAVEDEDKEERRPKVLWIALIDSGSRS